MSKDALFSEREVGDLKLHVEKCSLRYRELYAAVAKNTARLIRLELWMVGGMAAIIALLAKMAFWPGSV